MLVRFSIAMLNPKLYEDPFVPFANEIIVGVNAIVAKTNMIAKTKGMDDLFIQ
jgi:hypothetical protein